MKVDIDILDMDSRKVRINKKGKYIHASVTIKKDIIERKSIKNGDMVGVIILTEEELKQKKEETSL